MNKQEAEYIFRLFRRNPKYNRIIRATKIVHHRRGSVVQCVFKENGQPFTISNNSYEHYKEQIEKAKHPPPKLELRTKHGVPHRNEAKS